jgi:glycosyltransferase involved in cell wall biosynthesis
MLEHHRAQVCIEMEKVRNLNCGLGQFCVHLGRAMDDVLSEDQQMGKNQKISLDLTYYVPQNRRPEFPKHKKFLNWQAIHRFFLNPEKMDLWHCTHQQSVYYPKILNRSPRTPMILTLHDLNRNESRHLKHVQFLVNRSQHVVFISKFAEASARELLEFKNQSTSVIYNGNTLNHQLGPVCPTQLQSGPQKNKKFIFSLGVVHPKKNFHTLIPILNADPELQLVIAGEKKTDYVKIILNEATKLKVNDRVHLLGAVSENEKLWLYQNCEAFTFPSLLEGFGLPVIEAMSVGKPVFLSNLTSLPEIGGPNAYYFQSFDPHEMKHCYQAGMLDWKSSPARMNESKTWASQFSWSKAAQQYLALYQQVLNQARA